MTKTLTRAVPKNIERVELHVINLFGYAKFFVAFHHLFVFGYTSNISDYTDVN